jgi:hypothetical protein
MNLKRLYGQYKRLFKKEKKQGNIQNGVRQDTYKEFEYDMADPNYGSIKKILDAQRNVKQENKAKVWQQYKKMIKDEQLKAGTQTSQAGTYWGNTQTQQDGLKYHRTFSGLMKDRNAVHYIIAHRISSGEDEREVLADFGY